MHSTQHASDEFIDAITLLDQRHQSRDPALVIANIPEVRENQLLELFNLVLESHKVGNRLVALVRIVNGLQADVFLVLERAVELGMLLVEGQLG